MSVQILYFAVSISTLTGVGGFGDGFVDNNSASSFIVADGSQWPANLGSATTRARGNLRWRSVIQYLSENATIFSLSNITATGSNFNVTPTSMNFTVAYDRPDYLYAYDELVPGVKLYNQAAIKRWIARGLIQNITSLYPVVDPTQVTGITGAAGHYGYNVRLVNAGPLAVDVTAAEAAITVTAVPGV